MNNLSKNLLYLIKRFDTSQQELASFIKVSQNSISNWINEVSNPNAPALVGIYRYFGISIDLLLLGDIENSNLITDQQVEEFKANGNLYGNHSGNLNPPLKSYIVDEEGLKTVANEFDPTITYAMMSQFKLMYEKLEQLRLLSEEILKRGDK